MSGTFLSLYKGHDYTSINFLSTTFPNDHPSLLKQLQEAAKYEAIIEEAAQKFNLQSCIIAGLGSRESHWGLALFPPGPEGTGDFVPRIKTKPFRTTPLPPDRLGFGRGLLQIDFDYHEFARNGNWKDARENIFYGVKLLFDNRKVLLRKFKLNNSQLIRATLSSYNCGLGKMLKTIEKGYEIDFITTGRNYSQDVLNRAGWFYLQGWS
ncbi:MAG: Lysozyme g [candidate division Zixibacteria bacterium RBG-1]|nr:MAG: Lysozyme g [candidate division Zixibacteria bacterium RBG-1]OGC85971.1 MAG: hypothetical protein A2V73_04010 [candidate division Zixibacteria bacterium RBG_19FT_COMBO_42_43]